MNTLSRRKSRLCLLSLIFSLFLFQLTYANVIHSDTEGTCEWEIDDTGILTIMPQGTNTTCELSDRESNTWSWNYYDNIITGVHVYPENANTVKLKPNSAYLFYEFRSCSDWFGLSYMDASAVTNASHMFYGCKQLKNSNYIKNWAPSVSNIDSLFEGCSSLTALDLSKWNVSGVTTLSHTFSGCTSLKSLNLDTWDMSNIRTMPNAFQSVPSGLALNIDQYFPQKASYYPTKPYIYDKYSYEDFDNASNLSENPTGWVFKPYEVKVTFTGEGTGTFTATDGNVRTDAEAYYDAVSVFDNGNDPYDASTVYYSKGAKSTLQFAGDAPKYSVLSVKLDDVSQTLASDYTISSLTNSSYEYKVELEKTRYTLTYLAGTADSGDAPDPLSTAWDSSVTLSDNTAASPMQKAGYSFDGWTTDDGTAYAAGSSYTMPTEDVNLTAQFKKHSYTLSYDVNGGTGTPQTVSVEFNEDVTLLTRDNCDYALTGNTLTGWTDADGASHALGSTFTVPAQSADDATITLTAEYTKNKYTVTYAVESGVQGDVPDPVTDDYEASITLDDGSTLSKTGHKFDGWTSDGGTTTYAGGDTFDIPDENVTMTAIFTPETYVVYYEAGTGSGTLAEVSVVYDNQVTVADGDGVMTKTGYTFSNWQDEGENIWNPGDQFWMPDHDKTLTAQYTINSYTLTYDAGTGTGTIPAETMDYDSQVTVKDGSAVSMTGNTFYYWEDENSNQYNPGDQFWMPDHDMTLTAVYVPNTYTVHYEAPDAEAGTENLPADELIDYENTVFVADDCGLTKYGHTITGWQSSFDGTVYLADGTDSFDMPALENNNDTLTLTAVFTPNPWTLTYTAGSGTGDDQSETVDYGTTITLSLGSGFSMTGHGLTGWTDGTDSYLPGAEFTMPDNDVTLEAVFTPGTYTIYYDIDGATGTAPTGAAVAYQTVVTVADDSTFSKEGHTFVNWADVDGNTYEAGDTFPMPDNDMILQAQYSVNSYTLSYAAGSGTGTVPGATMVPYGTEVTLDDGSGLTIAKTGWSFMDWKYGTTVYQGGDSFTMPAQDVTLTAEYGPNVHTLSYTASEATSGTVPGSEQVSYGSVVTAADGTGLSLPGYVFGYWTDGVNKYASGQTFTMPDSDVTLEAIFAEEEYIVVFTLGSAQSGTAPAQVSVAADGSFILPENTGELAKPGYTFAGWMDDKGKIYQPGDVYKLNLTAKGLLTVITVTFDPVFVKNNQEKNFFMLPGAYELPAAFENVTVMPGTGFSALRPTALREQPASLAYHTTALELMLPSQEVSAAVQVIPMENGSWAVDWLGSTAGMLEGSALPGEGPCFIAAHNHLNTTETGPFWALSSLEVNDRLFVRNEDSGDLQTYSVYESVQYGANDFAEMAAKAYSDDAGLVLITCEDESAEGGYLHRRVVFAK